MSRVLALALLLMGCSGMNTIVITGEQLQTEVEKKFPLKKRVLIADVSLENPQATLNPDDDRLELALDLSVRAGPLALFPGRMKVDGRLTYQPDNAALYLLEPEVKEIDVPNLPGDLEGALRDTMTLAVRAHLSKYPVHRFDKEELEGRTVRSIQVEGGELRVEIGK